MTAASLVSRESPAAVFVNPIAGRGRANAHVSQLRKFFAAQNFFAEFVLPASATELESSARLAVAAGSKVLLAMGGDGTFQALVNAAHGSDAVLGLLPTGGGNDVAAALGLPGKNPIGAAEAIFSGEPRAIDLLCAHTADGRERLYVGGGGMGLDADAAGHAGGAYRRVPGRWRYIAAALRALWEFQPLRVRAEFPDPPSPTIERNILFAAVLNTPTYGAGVRLAPAASIGDGLLTAAFFNDLSAIQVLALLPRLMARGDLPEGYIQRVVARRVRLIPDRPCVFHGDGEILGPAPVEIEVLPQAMRVLAPAPRALASIPR